MPSVAARELAELELSALAERLLALADTARRAAVGGDFQALVDLRDALRDASESSSGASLSLLEVATAFVEALARSDLSPAELAIRAFCVRHSEEAGRLFGALLAEGAADPRVFSGFSDEVQNHIVTLVNRGVLRRADGVLNIQPRFFALVRDLVEPPAFRMWHAVKRARERAAFSERNEAISILEAVLGVTRSQAEIHLNHFHLRQEAPSAGPKYQAKPWSKPATIRVGKHSTGAQEEPSSVSQSQIPLDLAKSPDPEEPREVPPLPNETRVVPSPRREPRTVAN